MGSTQSHEGPQPSVELQVQREKTMKRLQDLNQGEVQPTPEESVNAAYDCIHLNQDIAQNRGIDASQLLTLAPAFAAWQIRTNPSSSWAWTYDKTMLATFLSEVLDAHDPGVVPSDTLKMVQKQPATVKFRAGVCKCDLPEGGKSRRKNKELFRKGIASTSRDEARRANAPGDYFSLCLQTVMLTYLYLQLVHVEKPSINLQPMWRWIDGKGKLVSSDYITVDSHIDVHARKEQLLRQQDKNEMTHVMQYNTALITYWVHAHLFLATNGASAWAIAELDAVAGQPADNLAAALKTPQLWYRIGLE